MSKPPRSEAEKEFRKWLEDMQEALAEVESLFERTPIATKRPFRREEDFKSLIKMANSMERMSYSAHYLAIGMVRIIEEEREKLASWLKDNS